MKRRALVLAGSVAGVAGLLAGPALWQRLGADRRSLAESVFADLAGRPRRLSEWPAELLLLNFWATWCAPCREEIPLLMAARTRHAARGLEVLGVAIDLPARVAEYARAMQIGYPLLVAEQGAIDLMRRLGNPAGALPFSVLVRGGEIAHRKLGAFTAVELEAAIARALA